MVEIIPAILTDNLDELKELINRAEGNVEKIQIDIIDGKFADNKTVTPKEVEGIGTNLKIDFHLMVNEPSEWIGKCVKAKGTRVIGQIEKMTSQVEFLEKAHNNDVLGGLAIDLGTNIEAIEPEALSMVDVVLVMSVRAGFGGQEYEIKALKKMVELDKIRNEQNLSFRICDDGGVSLETVGKAHFSGVDEVSIGRRLFEGNLAKNIEKFQNKAHMV